MTLEELIATLTAAQDAVAGWRSRAKKAEAEIEILKAQIVRERDLDLKIMARMENNK